MNDGLKLDPRTKRASSGVLRAALAAPVVALAMLAGGGDARAEERPSLVAPPAAGHERPRFRFDAPPGLASACSASSAVPGAEFSSCGAFNWVFVIRQRRADVLEKRRALLATTWLPEPQHGLPEGVPERAPTMNGFEMPPLWKVEADYEIFKLIADLTNTSIIQHSYGSDLEDQGAFRSLKQLESSRQRATYLDVEEYVGTKNEPLIDPPYFAGGASLTALAGALAMLHMNEVESAGVQASVLPYGWPPGLRVAGHFMWP